MVYRTSTVTAAAINETAVSWLLRVEASASAELWEGLQKWLDVEPRHRAAFIRIRYAWQRTDKLKLLRSSDGRVDKDLLSKLTCEDLKIQVSVVRFRSWPPLIRHLRRP